VTGAPRRWGGLLRQREFRLLWVGETTTSAGNSITKVALPLVAVTTLRAVDADGERPPRRGVAAVAAARAARRGVGRSASPAPPDARL
jgi:hypothetical protein